MYDRTTNTLWHQFLGEPAVGPLADSEIKLEVIPVLVATWGEWLATHPDTTVLDINTGVYPAHTYLREEDSGSIYFNYRESPETMFPVPEQSDLLPTKAQVLGLIVGKDARAYPLELLLTEPVINDSLGGRNIVVVTSVVGGGARAYERATHQFSPLIATDEVEGILTVADEQGRKWRVEEEALVLEEAPEQRLRRLPSHMAYWFGWYSFHPATDVYGKVESRP